MNSRTVLRELNMLGVVNGRSEQQTRSQELQCLLAIKDRLELVEGELSQARADVQRLWSLLTDGASAVDIPGVVSRQRLSVHESAAAIASGNNLRRGAKVDLSGYLGPGIDPKALPK